MKLPSHALIGTQTYKIVQRKAKDDGGLSDALAYTLVETNLIVISADLPTDRQRAVLLHELLHAIIYTFTRLDKPEKLETFDDWEHYFIGVVQEPMVMLIRDNPHLVTYLTHPTPPRPATNETNTDDTGTTIADQIKNKSSRPR